MGFKSVVLVLTILICLAFQAVAQDTYNRTSIVDDVRKSFQDESLFNVSARTGMSPGVPEQRGVRTPVAFIPLIPVSGNWNLKLVDTGTTYMNLTLFQSQDAVSGYGVVSKDGRSAQVSVGGTAVANRLALYVTPVGTPNLYRMTLTIAPGSLDGNYLYDSQESGTQPGVVFGSLIASPQGSPQTYNGAYIQPVAAIPLGPKNQY